MTPNAKQLAYLEALRDGRDTRVMTKRGLRNTRVGYACRRREWAEMVWPCPDGVVRNLDEITTYYGRGNAPWNEMGEMFERITPAGLAALAKARGDGE